MISEASWALAHLDGAALDELGRRVQAMSNLNPGVSAVADSAHLQVLQARFRIFSALLKATGENLATLQRAEAQEAFGRDPFGVEAFGQTHAPRGLFESFGMYDERDVRTSIWPASAAGNRKLGHA